MSYWNFLISSLSSNPAIQPMLAQKTPLENQESTSGQNLGNSTLLPALVVALVAVSFILGVLWQRVSDLQKGGASTAGQANVAAPAPQAPLDPTVPVKADTLNLDPVSDKDHVRGSASAKLTLIEYSDLECPFCKRIHPDLQKLTSAYDGKIRWVYRHFPLASLHSKAPKEAEAAECAAAAGGDTAFWKYIDKVFEVTPANNGLDPDELPKIAAQVGLNSYAFKRCLSDGKYKSVVDADYASGTKAGVNGTPGSFVLDDKGNAWIINGALPYDTLKSIVEKALNG